jgi:hypothetical protein
VEGNRYSPSYLAIIACVACFSKSISFPAIANCSAIELPVFGREIDDVVLEDFRVRRRIRSHEKNPRRGYFSLSTLQWPKGREGRRWRASKKLEMVVKCCARLRRQDVFVKGRDASVVFVECADGREESEEGSDLNLSMGTEHARLG